MKATVDSPSLFVEAIAPAPYFYRYAQEIRHEKIQHQSYFCITNPSGMPVRRKWDLL
jgi:hypothetical protein